MQTLNTTGLDQTRQTPVALFQAQLYQELAQSTLKHWLDDHKVAKHLDEKIQHWAFEAKSSLDQQHPYLQVQQQLQAWLNHRADLTAAEFQQMLNQYQAFNQILNEPDLTESLRVQAQQELLQRDGRLAQQTLQLNTQLLKEKWQRKLTQAIADWEFEQLALQRDAFLQEMKDFLATLQKMAKHKDSLGLDTGIFIDYSRGQLRPQDVQQFEQWCQYLEQDAELLKLCRMLGAAQPSQKRRQARQAKRQPALQWLQQQQLHEEIVGLKLAQELSLALPSELALLADPDLDIWFDLKYLESNLMSFNMQGQQQARVIQDPQQAKHVLGQQGPMVVCLDTSGSMHGQPELIAKAIVLYLATQAMKSKRAMYIINFSTQLTTLNLQHQQALDELIHFLSQSFHGGTDILPAIEHAVEMLADDSFQNADVVVVSDFIMGQVGEALMQQVHAHQQRGNGFYAVAIANLHLEHLDSGLFDRQWIYQSKTGKVLQLN